MLAEGVACSRNLCCESLPAQLADGVAAASADLRNAGVAGNGGGDVPMRELRAR
jgi:hypothetical protein